MRVVFTTAARSDLAAVDAYLRQESSARAEAVTRDLFAACNAIADLPFGSPIVPRYAERGYRRKVHRSYLIFYRVSGETIEIVRVLHGVRDHVRLLK